MTVAYLTHPFSLAHEMGPDHPESPDRVRVVHAALASSGLLAQMQPHPLQTLPEDLPIALRRAHSDRLLEQLHSTAPDEGYARLDADTVMNPATLSAALFAAASCLTAVDLVTSEGAIQRAFCNIRPPGHHAERDQAMGFCFLNNAAVGVLHALHKHHLDRVALIDFDVHHGNGSEDILVEAMNAGRVLMASTFQYPLYPGSGLHPLADRNSINIPLPSGSRGDALREAVLHHWMPALDAFRPQLMVISAGFDAHAADPLATLKWDENDYAWLTEVLCDCANRHAQGRIVSTLEGGYDLEALAASATAHVRALLDHASA